MDRRPQRRKRPKGFRLHLLTHPDGRLLGAADDAYNPGERHRHGENDPTRNRLDLQPRLVEGPDQQSDSRRRGGRDRGTLIRRNGEDVETGT